MDKKVLCPLPFVHPFFDVRGYYSACCNGSFFKDSKHVSQMTAEEWFYSSDMEQLREDMLTGTRNKMCDHCWKKDDLGITSPRINHIDYWKWHNVDYDNPRPRYFDLKPSNHCNLACIFCTASSSDKIIKITDSLPDNMKPTRWKNSLEFLRKNEVELGSTFDSTVVEYIKNNIGDLELLKFTGGEPFLSKEVYDILLLISEIKPSVEIKITSNGTVITKEFYPILQKMKKTSIKFSIDAVDELYSYVRFPSKWNQFQTRIERAMLSLPEVKFNVNCLITNMNLEQIPKIRNWFKELQTKFDNLEYITIDPNMHPDTNESSLHMMLPDVLKQLKTKLKEETEHWDMFDNTDKQIKNVFKKIDDAINNNYFNLTQMRNEFTRQNHIRCIDIRNVVEPVTSEFFKEILK